MMRYPRFSEDSRRAGVCYASTDDGIELPVIDVTHPAFEASDARQAALTREFVESETALVRLLFRLPKRFRDAVAKMMFSGSVVGAEIRRADGTFLSGMGTYLMKLGPENLGAWARPIDRRVVAALPALAMRWRLRDVAQMLFDALEPVSESRRPLHLVNIAGGPALDSLNAILLLHRKRSLAGRAITITVLDGDDHGPSFGSRALEAWKKPGAPLEGVPAQLRHVRYDWSCPDELARALDGDAHVVVSSEGGLFEYGSDHAITSNLEVLRGRVVAVVGSVTRADGPMQVMKRQSTAATIPRGLAAFRALARRAGFDVVRAIERPFSDQVTLVQSPTRPD